MANKYVDSLDDLFKMIQKDVNKVLRDDVEKVARRQLKENVITEVYDEYEPTQYERTGGLYQDENIDSDMETEDTLTIRSTRSEEGKDIAKIIETGEGYTWDKSKIAQTKQARPFHEVTADELRNGIAEDAMKRGLQKLGYETD